MIQKTGADGKDAKGSGAAESLNPGDAIEFMCAEARRLGSDMFDAVAGES